MGGAGEGDKSGHASHHALSASIQVSPAIVAVVVVFALIPFRPVLRYLVTSVPMQLAVEAFRGHSQLPKKGTREPRLERRERASEHHDISWPGKAAQWVGW